jgi:hypothetical protein
VRSHPQVLRLRLLLLLLLLLLLCSSLPRC